MAATIKVDSPAHAIMSGGQPRTALILIDVINRFDFPGADRLVPRALAAGRNIARLRQRCRDAHVPVIYANDNHGRWRSNFAQVIATCRRAGAPGAALVDLLEPDSTDYSVLKPQQSAFFRTPLHDLLQRLRVRRLVLAGLAGDGCVLATAIDATMRQFDVVVPPDCSASITAARHSRAMALMRDAMSVRTPVSTRVRVR